MKFLVTGAAGFIGYHVTERLLAMGHQVVGIDNLNDYYAVSLKQARLDMLANRPAFQFIKLDWPIAMELPSCLLNISLSGSFTLAPRPGALFAG